MMNTRMKIPDKSIENRGVDCVNNETRIDEKEEIVKDVKPLFLTDANAMEGVKEVKSENTDIPEAEVSSTRSSLGLISYRYLGENLQLDQGGMVPSVLEVEELCEKVREQKPSSC